MFIIITILVLSLLITLSHDIIKLLRIGKLYARYTSSVNPELLEELEKAKANVEAVKKGPAAGEYSLLIKTMRAERKVKDIQEKIGSDRNMGRIKSATVDLIGGYVLKIILSLVLMIFTYRHRYDPVIVYDERFYFAPLGSIISFPTGIDNAISVPVWTLSCNLSLSRIIKMIKGKMKSPVRIAN